MLIIFVSMRKLKPRDYFIEIEQELSRYYDLSEASSLTRIILEEFLLIDRTKLVINDEVTLSQENLDKISQVIEKLQAFIPIQYIIGHAPFFGRDFVVTNSVLIPRPETEELVDWIIKDNQDHVKLLDIGTGTGCIPITIAKETGLKTYGIDVSDKALEVASKNQEKHGANTEFSHLDILLDSLPFSDLDIIVSNPPYIQEKEKIAMHQNVVDHEPGLALFVPDDRPLMFYEEIADVAQHKLNPSGILFFEINEAFGKEVVKMMEQKGFSGIELRQDLNGKDRMVKGIKK